MIDEGYDAIEWFFIRTEGRPPAAASLFRWREEVFRLEYVERIYLAQCHITRPQGPLDNCQIILFAVFSWSCSWCIWWLAAKSQQPTETLGRTTGSLNRHDDGSESRPPLSGAAPSLFHFRLAFLRRKKKNILTGMMFGRKIGVTFSSSDPGSSHFSYAPKVTLYCWATWFYCFCFVGHQTKAVMSNCVVFFLPFEDALIHYCSTF